MSTSHSPKPEPRKTSQVTVSRQGLDLNIDVRWLSKSSWFFITFALLWNSFCAVIYGVMFHSGAAQKAGWPIFLHMSMFAAAGAFLAYKAACEIFNTTRITLDSKELRFLTTPFSIGGGRFIPRNEIAGFNLEQKRIGSQNGQPIYEWHVQVKFTDGKTGPVCRGQDQAEAVYIEKLLEDQFGFIDDPAEDDVQGRRKSV